MRRLIGLVAVAGCTSGGSPALRDPGDQRVAVGQTLVVDLYATDPDGDDLRYAFAAHGVPDLGATATLSTAPDVEACVCAADDYCCAYDGVWDDIGVIAVGEALCGPACVPDDDGPCCEPGGTAGCEVDVVEQCVCAEDPLCCADDPGWDEACLLGVEEYGCGTCPGG